MKAKSKQAVRKNLIQKSLLNTKSVFAILSFLTIAGTLESSVFAQTNSSGRSGGSGNAAGGVGSGNGGSGGAGAGSTGTYARRNHFSDGVSPSVRLTAEEKELLSSFMQTAKKVLEKALLDAQGKIFADANAIYLRAIKRVVKASSEQGLKSELLLRIALNQALDLTFGFNGSTGEEDSAGEKSKPGILKNTINQDLLTLILEDSIKLSLSFYENDYQAVQKGSLIDLPYMDFAYKKLELSHKWLASIPEPIKQYQVQVRTLQHFMNVAANPDQKERAKYADALLNVDELLEEYPSDRPVQSDNLGVMKAVRLLRGENKKLREMVRVELANRPAPAAPAPSQAPATGQVPAQNPAFVAGPVNPAAYGMRFVALPGGTFQMGRAGTAGNRSTDEMQHTVTLSPFEMQTTEVTQSQYFAVMGTNPSQFKTKSHCPSEHQVIYGVELCPNHPVENLDWNQATAFAAKLTETARDGYRYRLPTEAEWEFAAQAGSNTSYSFGDDASRLTDYAWFDKKSGNQTHAVGGKLPNAYGLFDMHGNVWEWVQDWYDANYYQEGQVNPTGPASGVYRVLRGGRWDYGAVLCRSAFRYSVTPVYRFSSLGFRLLRTR